MIDKARPNERFNEVQRWPKVLQTALGSSWLVIEEGLKGRTTDRDDPSVGEHRNGQRFLRACLESHKPIDVLIFMLGTNDLKVCYHKTPEDVGASLSRLILETRGLDIGRAGTNPSIILVSPPIIRPTFPEYVERFAGGREKSLLLPLILKGVALRLDTGFFDNSEADDILGPDGVHMNLLGHTALGKSLAEVVRNRSADRP